MNRTPSLVSLALLALVACKETGGFNDRTLDPATGQRDAATAPSDAGRPQQDPPPFDWTDLFPQPRDAGRPRVVDAGRAPTSTKLPVGPQGDLLYLEEEGIALDVPARALTRTIEITFADLPSPPPGFSGRAWLLSPPETRFAVPARVAIQIPADLLKVAPANAWAVATLQNGAWVALPKQVNDAGGILVHGETSVLGAFALIQVPPRGEVPKDASVADAGGLDGGVLDASVVDSAVIEDAEVDTGVADVDECAMGIGVCVIVGTVCVNDPGTYHCACVAPNVLLPTGTCGLP